MHDRYSGKWYKTFSFNQTTEVYRNDTLKPTETWYENIKFPKDFRIDFGNPGSGNAVIFKNDSSYFFKNGKHAGVRRDENDLIFLLGGMYFYSFDEVITKLNHLVMTLINFMKIDGKGKTFT